MKVFVLNYLEDHTDDMSFGCTCGVFKTIEDAKKAMEEEFEERLINVMELNDVETKEELEEIDDVNLNRYDESNEWSIYNNGDVDEWKITEWELD